VPDEGRAVRSRQLLPFSLREKVARSAGWGPCGAIPV